jgi:hypothetical protein
MDDEISRMTDKLQKWLNHLAWHDEILRMTEQMIGMTVQNLENN